MARYDLRAILARTDCRDVCRERGIVLDRHGRGRCPLCGLDRRPSFSASREKWHCFRCGRGGDVFALVMQLDGVDFPVAVEILAKRLGLAPLAPETRAERDERFRRERERQVEREEIELHRRALRSALADAHRQLDEHRRSLRALGLLGEPNATEEPDATEQGLLDCCKHLEGELRELPGHESQTARAVRKFLDTYEPPEWRSNTTLPVPPPVSPEQAERVVKALLEAIGDVSAEGLWPERGESPQLERRAQLAALEERVARPETPEDRALAEAREHLAAEVLAGDLEGFELVAALERAGNAPRDRLERLIAAMRVLVASNQNDASADPPKVDARHEGTNVYQPR